MKQKHMPTNKFINRKYTHMHARSKGRVLGKQRRAFAGCLGLQTPWQVQAVMGGTSAKMLDLSSSSKWLYPGNHRLWNR